MPRLTSEQARDLKERQHRFVRPDDFVEQDRDSAVSWWVEVEERLTPKLMSVDRDQLRSASIAHKKWVI